MENEEPKWQRIMVRGSLITPDPILLEIQHLEQIGQVKDVVILESYPLQIWLSADLVTIKKLQSLTKK